MNTLKVETQENYQIKNRATGGAQLEKQNNKIDLSVEKQYFTQKELAERWQVSAGTIINRRKEGRIPYFQIPGSNKVLYPVNELLDFEQKNTTTIREVKSNQRQYTESQREQPVVSTKPQKDWRI